MLEGEQMTNDHVAEPFRSILENILKPKSYSLPVGLDAAIQPATRFHPDDVTRALDVLVFYYSKPETLEGWHKLEQAFSHCLVALDAAMKRRENDELNARLDRQYRYELGRRAWANGDTVPVLHDSDSEPGR
jgi:hypothetical protein